MQTIMIMIDDRSWTQLYIIDFKDVDDGCN